MRGKRIDGLKLEYRTRELIWNYGLKRIFEKIFVITWKHVPLVAYPLAIDFAFGTLKYFYLKHGAKAVWERLMDYNNVLVARIKGTETEDYNDLLTEQGQLDRQLDKEIEELEEQYSYN